MTNNQSWAGRVTAIFRRWRWLACGLPVLLLAEPGRSDEINTSPTIDAVSPVARLQERIDRGEVKLAFDPDQGYLPALLKALNVPACSQTLVFCKTSLQKQYISPQNPRAIFFNDEVYVAWVPGAPLLEVADVDPQQGGVFYSLEQKPLSRPKLERCENCLDCHHTASSMGVPGFLTRSYATDEHGVPDPESGLSMVNDQTALNRRWGGWYVTGLTGVQQHLGNLVGIAAWEQQQRHPDTQRDVLDLRRFIDPARYPTPSSDVVALMVMDHQTYMQNFLALMHQEIRRALKEQGKVHSLFPLAEEFLKYLLFTEEAPLAAPVKGTSKFAAWFENQGPKDGQGRSLRQFDLRTRLFKYPCSFLIYSPAFEALDEPMKRYLYRRLWDILSGRDPTPAYKNIPSETRLAIREILQVTKTDLPDYWAGP